MNSNGWHKAQCNSCGQMRSTLHPMDSTNSTNDLMGIRLATYNSCHFENVFHNNLKRVTFSERKLRVPTTRQLSSYQNDDLIQPNRLSLFVLLDDCLQSKLSFLLRLSAAKNTCKTTRNQNQATTTVSCISTENVRSPACFVTIRMTRQYIKLDFMKISKLNYCWKGGVEGSKLELVYFYIFTLSKCT